MAEKPTEAETPMILTRPKGVETKEEFISRVQEMMREQILDTQRTVD